MIKGLYFKLNMDNRTDKDIYDFFIQESKERGISKILLLFSMMCMYKCHEDEIEKKSEDRML